MLQTDIVTYRAAKAAKNIFIKGDDKRRLLIPNHKAQHYFLIWNQCNILINFYRCIWANFRALTDSRKFFEIYSFFHSKLMQTEMTVVYLLTISVRHCILDFFLKLKCFPFHQYLELQKTKVKGFKIRFFKDNKIEDLSRGIFFI